MRGTASVQTICEKCSFEQIALDSGAKEKGIVSVRTICEKCSFEQIALDTHTTENSTLKVIFLEALMVGRMVDIQCKFE